MIFITLSGIAIGIAVTGLAFVYTRPVSPRVRLAANIMHTLTMAVSVSTISYALVHLGEPQACWLFAEILGVAIDACQP